MRRRSPKPPEKGSVGPGLRNRGPGQLLDDALVPLDELCKRPGTSNMTKPTHYSLIHDGH
jgi:hypothetical protein